MYKDKGRVTYTSHNLFYYWIFTLIISYYFVKPPNCDNFGALSFNPIVLTSMIMYVFLSLSLAVSGLIIDENKAFICYTTYNSGANSTVNRTKVAKKYDCTNIDNIIDFCYGFYDGLSYVYEPLNKGWKKLYEASGAKFDWNLFKIDRTETSDVDAAANAKEAEEEKEAKEEKEAEEEPEEEEEEGELDAEKALELAQVGITKAVATVVAKSGEQESEAGEQESEAAEPESEANATTDTTMEFT